MLPAAGTTELAGLGSHLDSSLPEIRVDENGQDQADIDSIEANQPRLRINTQLVYNSQYNIANELRSGGPRQNRADSLIPGSSSGNGSSARDDSTLTSYSGHDSESDDYEFATPLIRRCSFMSDNPLAVSLEHHNDSSDTDEYPEMSDSEDSRPYTGRQMLPVQTPNLSRGTSVISDGGEQDHLELHHTSALKPDSPCKIGPVTPGTSSKRYALQKQINSVMQTARADDPSIPIQRFFPKDKLGSIITPGPVAAELAIRLLPECTKDAIQQYAEKICSIEACSIGGKIKRRSYRSIFVILVLADQSRLIRSFIDQQVSDLDLPLIPFHESGSIIGMTRHGSNADDSRQPLLECFDDEEWSPSQREQFDRIQWSMLAPFFSSGKHSQINHYPLHNQHILPFVEAQDDDAESRGGYGRVIMVRIHPAHHKLGRKTNHKRGFAVKQLLNNDRRSFKREREMLKKFSGVNSHPHIVSLLATYRQRNKYHFIFDRARGDLVKLWNKEDTSPKLDHDDMLWIADQCAGIAAGLFKIHRHTTAKKQCAKNGEDIVHGRQENARVTFLEGSIPVTPRGPVVEVDGSKTVATAAARTFSSESELPGDREYRYGRHGDINPQNILWFTNDDDDQSDPDSTKLRGTLKIADFGTAEMHSLYSRTGDRVGPNTMTYRPPEVDSPVRRIRAEFDIWCLGCVLLEFVTWTLGGARLLRKFSSLRRAADIFNDSIDTYYELRRNKDKQELEARVKETVLRFVEKLRNSPRCTEFHHRLLNLVMFEMLLVDSRSRLRCKAVCQRLQKIRDSVASDAHAMDVSQWSNGEHVSPDSLLQWYKI
ncbi:hypothetical protein ACEQ8H_001878 [Pleosporales sp. CAS-2024a]